MQSSTGAVVLRRRVGYAELGAQAFAPDASALLLTDNERLLRVDLPSGKATVLLRTGKLDNDPPRAWWGRSGRSPPQGLGVIVPGQAPGVLVPISDRKLIALAWSPDGRTLAVEHATKAPPRRERRGRRGRWPERVARTCEMTSRPGDATVRAIVLRATRALRAGAGREETLLGVRNDLNRLDHRFDSVTDSEVPEAVADELDRWLRAAGFKRTDGNDEVQCPAPEGPY